MKELLCNYEAPELEIVEVVLENGIAFTLTINGNLEELAGGGFELENLDQGEDFGVF